MEISQFPKPFESKVDQVGRVVIPAEVRKQLGIQTGDEVIVEADDRGIHIYTRMQALREAQDYYCSLAPSSVIMSKELIRQRRDEAERD